MSACVGVVAACAVVGVGSVRAVAPPDGPGQLRLGWTEDGSTTVTVRWQFTGTAEVLWRPADGGDWTTESAEPLGKDQWQVVISGLTPDTAYEYRLEFDGVFSPSRVFRTAPSPDDGAPVRLAFVADTGIVGRLDGLATGTERVLTDIATRDPLALLAGGDFAYLNSEDRYDDQDRAMDAWFSMMEPLAATTPVLPAYGNHEVLLDEDVDLWADRFATPDGSPDGLSFSVDIGGVHVVSLLAYEQRVDEATMEWLVQDLVAASERDVTAIVPFFHRNLYGNGTVHPPSGDLADQLAPLFDLFDVEVVMTAHDQSYERTLPLASGQPTTSSVDCYGPDDGTTYVKTSPGGKLSNVTWDFSGYEPGGPDAVIAARENQLHHYSIIEVEQTAITVTTYGLVGDASEAVVVDRFTYGGDCRPRPVVSPSSVAIDTGEATTARVDVPDGARLEVDADWLTVDRSGQIEVGELPAGRHATIVRAIGEEGGTTPIPVVVHVPGGDPDGEIRVAADSDGTAARLDGSLIGGEVFIEFEARETLEEVRFLLDGAPVRSDRGAPFDLVVDDDGSAMSFDTLTLAPGAHRLTAVAVGGDGSTREVTAAFAVDPDAPPVTAAPPSTAPTAFEPGGTPLGTGDGWGGELRLIMALVVLGGVVGAGLRFANRLGPASR